MKQLMFSVAIGEPFKKKCKVMMDSFRECNRSWETKGLFDREIDFLIPQQFRNRDPFFKCEIGRWIFMEYAMENHYDTVLYCDGDIFWYDEYIPVGHGLVLSPHYVTDEAKRDAKHWLIKDGICNLGIIEANNCAEICDTLMEEVSRDPEKHMHGNQLWLQNLASYFPHIGYDVSYNTDPGLNVARWNLAHRDREVFFKDDKPYVLCGGGEYPLRSFHFSSKSFDSLVRFGDAVTKLRNDYLKRIS